MDLLIYKITGISPLLQNNPAVMDVQDGAPGLTSKKKVYDDKDEAARRAYANDDGTFFIPSISFRAAILCACKSRKIGKAFARTVMAASFFPTEERCTLIDPKTEKPLKGYELHCCRAVVNRTSGIKRVRPVFRNWSTKLAVDVDADMIPNTAVVLELLNIAGKIVGVQDWRPEKMGTYGRFTAEIA
jgi:hypothetical protein